MEGKGFLSTRQRINLLKDLNYLGYKALAGKRSPEEDRRAKEICDILYPEESEGSEGRAKMRVKRFVGDTCLGRDEMDAVGRLASVPMGYGDAARAVRRICEAHSVPAPKLEFTGRWTRNRRGTYRYSVRSGGRILIHRDGENEATVLHEVAHHLQKVRDGRWDGHGSRFAYWFGKVMRDWEGGPFGWPEWQRLWERG